MVHRYEIKYYVINPGGSCSTTLTHCLRAYTAADALTQFGVLMQDCPKPSTVRVLNLAPDESEQIE